jgi:hypothetical protein
MGYKVDIKYKDKYILIKVSGEDNFNSSLDEMKRFTKYCEKHNCYNILGISEINFPLDTIDAFNFYKIIKEAGINFKYRVAWVNKNPKDQKKDDFALTVMQNRGLGSNWKVFSSTSEARKWLLGEDNNKD